MSEIFRHTCTPRQARGFVTECLYAGLVPFLQSSPGLGKSSIMRSIARTEGLQLIDHRLSTSAPEDLSGLPRFNEKGFAQFAPFADLFPLDGTPMPKGNNGWLLFLDEFNAASRNVQAASYKLILDRMVGQHALHENCVIAAAGNLATDHSITNSLSTAMQSRVVHLEMSVDFNEWLEDVAIPEGYDHRIIGFLSQWPAKLHDFRPDHSEKTFCCPRTWEFMNRLVKDRPITEANSALYAGTITSGVATEFVQFVLASSDMVPVKEVLANPMSCRVPHEPASKWVTISALLDHVSAETFGALLDYTGRYDLAFRVLFFRGALVRQPELRRHPRFAECAAALTRYLVN